MRRRILTNQRSFGDERTADPAADRRADAGVLQIELGTRDVGLAGRNVRLGLADIGDSDIELRLSRSAARRQHLHALGVLLFLVQHHDGFSKGGFRGIHIDFEGPGVELVENVAGFNVAALLEIAVDHDAGHTRAHFAIRVGVMRPGNSRITASAAGCNSTTPTSGTDRLSSLLGKAGPSLQPDRTHTTNKAAAVSRSGKGRLDSSAAGVLIGSENRCRNQQILERRCRDNRSMS